MNKPKTVIQQLFHPQLSQTNGGILFNHAVMRVEQNPKAEEGARFFVPSNMQLHTPSIANNATLMVGANHPEWLLKPSEGGPALLPANKQAEDALHALQAGIKHEAAVGRLALRPLRNLTTTGYKEVLPQLG